MNPSPSFIDEHLTLLALSHIYWIVSFSRAGRGRAQLIPHGIQLLARVVGLNLRVGKSQRSSPHDLSPWSFHGPCAEALATCLISDLSNLIPHQVRSSLSSLICKMGITTDLLHRVHVCGTLCRMPATGKSLYLLAIIFMNSNLHHWPEQWLDFADTTHSGCWPGSFLR